MMTQQGTVQAQDSNKQSEGKSRATTSSEVPKLRQAVRFFVGLYRPTQKDSLLVVTSDFDVNFSSCVLVS